MNTYLAIMTTVLVLTQVIRTIQNYIQLKNFKNHISQNNEVVQMWDDLKNSIDELNRKLDKK